MKASMGFSIEMPVSLHARGAAECRAPKIIS